MMRFRRAPETEEGRLVVAILAGDSESYGVLVRRHQERLYRYAYGMVADSDVAADMVQDSLVRAYRSLRRCRNPDNFGGWVIRIVRNRCLDHLKERRRNNVPLDPELAEGESTVYAVDDRVVAGEAVRQALESTPDLLREAFLLKHVDDLSYDEMAEVTGASVSALKMRVKRAREHLAEALRPVRAQVM
jgi:RNA polymerase sigma-70 factor, ECF subfamily